MRVIHHFKETIIFFEPLSFQKENYLSYQNEETFCQDIVHPLVFWCDLVLIFSFSFPIAPWQKVSGYARSSVSFCSFRSKKKLMTAFEKKGIFLSSQREYHISSRKDIHNHFKTNIILNCSRKGEYSGSSYPIQNKIKLNQIWASYAHTLETRVSSWQRYAENSRSSNGQL